MLADVTAACGRVPAETAPIRDAVGSVLAEPLVIPGPVPAQARALRAGFAVASRDLVGVSAYAPLLVPEPPPRVEAGDPLPERCDAVLPEDGVARTGPLIEIVAAVGPGENARRAGEDGIAGQVLAEAGTVLRPAAAAAALSAGLQEAAIRRCDCRVLTAGDPSTGCLLLSAIPGLGVSGVRVETKDDWGRALASASMPITVALTNTGLGAAAEGLRPVARGLALRPGETTQVFMHGAGVVIVVPDRLEAVFSVGRCLLAPLAAHLTGLAPARGFLRGRLTRKLTSTIGFTEVALVRRTEAGLEPLASGSFSLASLAAAEGWFAVPPESEGLQEGESVEAHAL